jgi:hypothetical protein
LDEQSGPTALLPNTIWRELLRFRYRAGLDALVCSTAVGCKWPPPRREGNTSAPAWSWPSRPTGCATATRRTYSSGVRQSSGPAAIRPLRLRGGASVRNRRPPPEAPHSDPLTHCRDARTHTGRSSVPWSGRAVAGEKDVDWQCPDLAPLCTRPRPYGADSDAPSIVTKHLHLQVLMLPSDTSPANSSVKGSLSEHHAHPR